MRSIITLGGKGTRLKEITRDIPKPLFPIMGISPLERICIFLKENNIFSSIWLCGYKSNLFISFAKEMELKYEIEITVILENIPMGECGALRNEKLDNNETYIFLSGDIVFDFDLERVLDFHKINSAHLTLLTHTTTHADDSDCIMEDKSQNVYKYDFKSNKNRTEGIFLGNSGIYIFQGEKFNESIQIIKNKNLSFFQDIIPSFLKKKNRVMSYNTSEYIHDVGTVKRFRQTEKDLSLDLPTEKSYKKKQSCLFLDRDGTLIDCRKGEYIIHKNQMNLKVSKIKKLAEISKRFNCVEIITNQPAVSMSKITEEELFVLNGIIIKNCLDFGLKIDTFRYCPHHPHIGFDDEIKILKRKCFCRKPKPGLFLEAIYEKNISPENSLMIGDSMADKIAAEAVGIPFKNIKSI